MTSVPRSSDEADQIADEDSRGVSLKYSDSVADEGQDGFPNVGDIRAYRPAGERDDRLALTIPVFLRRAIEVLAALAERTTITHAALWALARGLRRLGARPEVQRICEARAMVLRMGSSDIATLDDWRYLVAARDGERKRMYFKCVTPSDAGKCADLARGLGLSVSTLGTIAIMAALVDTPLHDEQGRLIILELKEFGHGLRQRARLASDLRERALTTPAAVPTRVTTFEEVIGGED